MRDDIDTNGTTKTSRQKPPLPTKLLQLLQRRIYITQWLPKYSKLNLISDFIAGITVGLTMIPQSLAYASLADVPPQYGLYTAFIGSFAYVFFGTIKEVSIGPTSLMAILVFSYTQDKPVDFVVLLSFVSGCVVLLMGFFRLGFLVDFISTPVISGFTSATSVIIILGQIKGVLGIKFRSKGTIDLVHQMWLHMSETRTADASLGAACIIFLLGIKQLTSIKVRNKRVKKCLWLLSTSRNALTVLITSAIAFYYVNNRGGAPFIRSGDVPSGLPTFKPPPFSTTMNNKTLNFPEMLHELGSGIIVTPIVAVLANVAIAKSFAEGTIDATQEMLALGLCNIFGSFIQAMPATGAFTRSAVAHASGVRTPLQGVYSGTIILLALSFLTPYFRYIPKATLSAVLICAVMTLIDYEIVPKLMRFNKFDLGLTITTFCVCLLYGVEIGLLVGVTIDVLSTLKLWTRPRIQSKIVTDKTGEEIIVIQPELGILFPSVDYFTQEVVKRALETASTIPIALDFTNVCTVDFTACQALKNLIKVYKHQHRPLIFQNVSPRIYKLLKIAVNLESVHVYQKVEDEEFPNRPPNYEWNETDIPLLEVKGDEKS